MEQGEKKDLEKVLELRRDQEIQQMFAAYSDSNCIDFSELDNMDIHSIDFDFNLLLELVNKIKYQENNKKKCNEHRKSSMNA